MQMLIDASVILLAYIFGSIPFGLLIVKFSTGKDIRQVASGRTGGTNAARAAGRVGRRINGHYGWGKGRFSSMDGPGSSAIESLAAGDRSPGRHPRP